MNNNQLIKNWKDLSIRFKSSNEETELLDMFLICVGETEVMIGDKKEPVVVFYQGYDQKGSPAFFF